MKKKYFLIFIVTLIVTFLYTWFRQALICDEIWNYGVAYNIAHGLIPYKDFNLLTGPLYPFLGSIFINTFGNHLYSFEIFNAVIISLITLISYHKIGKSTLILYFTLICYAYPNYNIFCLLLLIIIIVINESNNIKYKDFLIGFLVGCIFITKQTIGICFFIVMAIFMPNRFKKICSFLIPCLILLIYLIFNNNLYEYIDYCYLGLFDFGSKNKILIFLIPFIILVTHIIYKIIKSNFKDKSLFFILAYTSVTIPIFDMPHFMYALIGYIFYLLIKYNKQVTKNYKYLLIISLSFFILNITKFEPNYHLYNDNSSIFQGKAIFGENSNNDKNISILKKYINNIRDEYKHIFIFSDEIAYAVKLDINYPISKFDMIANGNMGYNGANKLIKSFDNICKKETCIFLVDNSKSVLISQTNENILKHVKKNYHQIDEIKIPIKNIETIDESFHFLIYNNLGSEDNE